MAMLRDDRINYLNIGLMGITAILAYFMPFETFLFAYAFLGPLHYLTEISWLHDRQYFSKGKYDFIVLLVIGVLLSLAAFVGDFKDVFNSAKLDFYIYPPFSDGEISFLSWFYSLRLNDVLILLSLCCSIFFVFTKNNKFKYLSIFLLFIFLYFLFNFELDLLGILLMLSFLSVAVHFLIENYIIKIIAIAALFLGVYFFYDPNWFGISTEEKLSYDQYTSISQKTELASSSWFFAFTSLVPTLIHVYVFTGLFMLYGAMKSRSKSGLISVLALLVIPAILVFSLPVSSSQNFLSDYGKNAYYADGHGFFNVNQSILDKFNATPKLTWKQAIDKDIQDPSEREKLYAIYSDSLNNEFMNSDIPPDESAMDTALRSNPYKMYYGRNNVSVASTFPKGSKDKGSWWDIIYYSQIGIMLMRFIAFAYLYHYLNWFSKTEIIQWHKVPKARFITVIILWLAACGFYIYDYGLGLNVLFFLSFTHVLLEFPLNIVSIVGIGKESIAIFKHGFKPLKTDS